MELTLALSFLTMDTAFALKAELKGCYGGLPGSQEGIRAARYSSTQILLCPLP